MLRLPRQFDSRHGYHQRLGHEVSINIDVRSVQCWNARNQAHGAIPLDLLQRSHGLSKSIGRALGLPDSLGGALDLGATLAGVATPDLHGLRVGLGHRLGESLRRALELFGDVGSTLNLSAALARVAAPDGHTRLRNSSGLHGGGGSQSKGNGSELHDEG